MRENLLGDGARRARVFGDRLGVYNVAEAANLVGVVYSTVYHWLKHGVLGDRRELVGRGGQASKVFTPTDILKLAVLREVRSRTSSSGGDAKRGRTNAALRRAWEALDAKPEAWLDGWFVFGDKTADLIPRDRGDGFAGLDDDHLFAEGDQVVVVVDLRAVRSALPDVVRTELER